MSGTTLFTWLQGAPFYREIHARAVALVPGGPGSWIDVGCGPGLVTRLAAAHGYEAEGWDPDRIMIEAARRLARAERSPARFEVAGIDTMPARAGSAAVVSAASLLAVLPDRLRALDLLWTGVSPGGCLLVVETTPRMRPLAALGRARGPRGSGLLLWSLARAGRSCAAALDAWAPRGVRDRSFHPLLGGLVGAWLFRRDGLPGGRGEPR